MPVPLDATEYTFQGEGITASYFPQGAGGPLIAGRPETFFHYHDHHQSKAFGQDDIDVQQIANVGAFISVKLVESEFDGGPVTTFTVLVPAIGVAQDSPQTFKTKSITTVQAASYVAREVFPPRQVYKVDHLDGTASVHPLPR
jgi:hypothetical protein